MKYMNTMTGRVADIELIDVYHGPADMSKDFYDVDDTKVWVWNAEAERYESKTADIDQMINYALDWKYGRNDFFSKKRVYAPEDKKVWIDGTYTMDDPMNEFQIYQIATSLYDGGYRAEDRDGIAVTYQLEGTDLDKVCEMLADEEEAEEEDNE